MAKLAEAKANVSEKHPVFYEDEVDIDFNPKIGADWCFTGQQKRVITPEKMKNITLRAASMPRPRLDLTFLIWLLWVKITLHMLNKHTKEISKPINKIILNMRNYQYQCDD